MYNQNNTPPRGPHNTKKMRPNNSSEHPAIHEQPKRKPKQSPKRPRVYNDFMTNNDGQGGNITIANGGYKLDEK